MSDLTHDSTEANETQSLARVLRLVGLSKLLLAAMTLVLAFTGYETPRPVNVTLLVIGINLLVLGALCLSAGRSFRWAGRMAATDPALGEALRKMTRLFGYYSLLLVLAVLGVGYDLVTFLAKILSR
jgi:hypothetical protein